MQDDVPQFFYFISKRMILLVEKFRDFGVEGGHGWRLGFWFDGGVPDVRRGEVTEKWWDVG